VRKLPTRHIFGLDQVRPLTAIAWAAGLCLAALPLTHAVSLVTMLALKDNLAPQPLVQLFSEVARQNDFLAIAKIFFVGAIVAPACEEFLFRGFCYPIWKRYIGPIGSALLASLLFAALHTSLTAFASLFLLALCLNLAYERTGSLLVPIGIHAAFNSFSLLILYTQRFTVAPVSP
jgi:membrane protease YdiL (CAAX protease family)